MSQVLNKNEHFFPSGNVKHTPTTHQLAGLDVWYLCVFVDLKNFDWLRLQRLKILDPLDLCCVLLFHDLDWNHLELWLLPLESGS